MPKKKEEESPKKKRSKSYSRTKGHSYETKIAKELRELGYEGIITSRSESKSTDDKKVDLIDTQNQFPYYVQLKCTQTTPAYHQISAECPLKDKPFILIWNKQVKKQTNICSAGEVVIIPKEEFYKLIKLKE